MSNSLSKIVTGYTPLDFEQKVAEFLRDTFKLVTIPNPVDPTKTMPINVYESEFPERDVTKRNALSPYCIAQFIKEIFVDNGTIFLGRIIISTYGQNTSQNRQNNMVIGSHIVSKFIANPNIISPFSVKAQGKYKLTYELVDQQPSSSFVFGVVQFYALTVASINNMEDILNATFRS